jgi:VIT1/CCC1 family predicted Fe2+/Mn2+ transporter
MGGPITEGHRSLYAGPLRAGVLGANDGLLSTAAILIGIAAADVSRSALITAGVAALVAGALSMAVGEYSSVSSQLDAERADLHREHHELADEPEAELAELTAIYRRRGLDAELALEVARQLTATDALTTHARDELGLDPNALANPRQAAVTSALSFVVGALPPVLVVAAAPSSWRITIGVLVTLVGLGLLGYVGARLGRAPWRRPVVRVLVGGAIALFVSAAIGRLVGVAV